MVYLLLPPAHRTILDLTKRIQGPIQEGWVLVEVCFYVGLLVLFNAYPHKVGIWFPVSESRSFVPLLSSAFQVYLPWFNVWWSLSLLMAMAKVGLGRWTLALHWLDLGLCIFGIGLAVRLLLGGPFLGLESGFAVSEGIQLAQLIHKKVAQLNAAIRLGLGLWLILAAVRATQILLRVVKVARPGQGSVWANR